jgi:hypothetical protein
MNTNREHKSLILDNFNQNENNRDTIRFRYFLMFITIISICTFFIPLVIIENLSSFQSIIAKAIGKKPKTLSLYQLLNYQQQSIEKGMLTFAAGLFCQFFLLIEISLPILLLITLYKRYVSLKLIVEILYVFNSIFCFFLIIGLNNAFFTRTIYLIFVCLFLYFLDALFSFKRIVNQS